MIFKHEIDEQIDKLSAAGVNVYKDDYVIVASVKAKFNEDIYPLEIITSVYAPDVAVFIMKRPENIREALMPRSKPKL